MNALVYLEENLSSSIALRFADRLAGRLGMELVPIHVEEPDKKVQAGTGWVRRSWEQGVIGAGREEVARLLKTEQVSCPVREPVVVVGDRDHEVATVLQERMFDLYIEGYVNTSRPMDFVDLLAARRIRKSTTPALVVKNLVAEDRVVLLLGEGVDAGKAVAGFTNLYGGAAPAVEVALVYHRFEERGEMVFLQPAEAGVDLAPATEALARADCPAVEVVVAVGSPEAAAAYLRDHGLVVTTLPSRRGVRSELLALLANPVLLLK